MDLNMTTQRENHDFFRKTMWILGLLAALGLFGYALINLIRMPAVSPNAFVPKSVAPAQPAGFPFGLAQAFFILLYSFAFLPVVVMFTIKRYAENPYALVLGCSLLCLSLVLEIVNNLPVAGVFVYPEPLEQISPDIALYLKQTAAIQYLSLDVAGFTLFYAAMLVYMLHYWKTKRYVSWMVIVSVITFATSAPCLWFSGGAAVALMAVSVICVSPVPLIFGYLAFD
jgi:hypothetical protein